MISTIIAVGLIAYTPPSQTPDERASGQAFAKVLAEARDDDGNFLGEEGMKKILTASIEREMRVKANSEVIAKHRSLIKSFQDRIDGLNHPTLSLDQEEAITKYQSLIKDIQNKLDKFESLSIPVDSQMTKYAKATMKEIQGHIDQIESPPLNSEQSALVKQYQSQIRKNQEAINKLQLPPSCGPTTLNVAKKIQKVIDAYNPQGSRVKAVKQRLNLAQSLEKQAKTKGAIEFYKAIVKDYDTFPFSPLKTTAAIARERLKIIDRDRFAPP